MHQVDNTSAARHQLKLWSIDSDCVVSLLPMRVTVCQTARACTYTLVRKHCAALSDDSILMQSNSCLIDGPQTLHEYKGICCSYELDGGNIYATCAAGSSPEPGYQLLEAGLHNSRSSLEGFKQVQWKSQAELAANGML